MNFGWSCMSWRQPASSEMAASALKDKIPLPPHRRRPVAGDPVVRIRFIVLILHLHHGDRLKPFKKDPRLGYIEFRIGRLKAQEEFVRGRATAEVGRVKERMVNLRQAVDRQHT